jgi:hypothetical protein
VGGRDDDVDAADGVVATTADGGVRPEAPPKRGVGASDVAGGHWPDDEAFVGSTGDEPVAGAPRLVAAGAPERGAELDERVPVEGAQPLRDGVCPPCRPSHSHGGVKESHEHEGFAVDPGVVGKFNYVLSQAGA